MNFQNHLPQRVAGLAARLTEAASEIYGGRHGLSRDEWRVLAAAGEAQGQPTRSVAAITGMDKVAISRAASALEARRLIVRSEDRADRRIKIVHLTPRGAAKLAALKADLAAREAQLVAGLSAASLATFEEVLETLTLRAADLADAARDAEAARDRSHGGPGASGAGSAAERMDGGATARPAEMACAR